MTLNEDMESMSNCCAAGILPRPSISDSYLLSTPKNSNSFFSGEKKYCKYAETPKEYSCKYKSLSPLIKPSLINLSRFLL